jgi:hypothetical protein
MTESIQDDNNSFNATVFLSLLFSLLYIMSRQQGHRKSQSTSALNVLASPSPHHLNQSTATPRTSRRQGSSRLGAVVEDDSERSDRQYKPESSRDGMESMISGITTRTPRKDRTYHEKDKVASFGLEDLRAAIGDVSIPKP